MKLFQAMDVFLFYSGNLFKLLLSIKQMRWLLIFLIFILTFSETVFASEIHGRVFDFELQPVNGAVVEISSSPQQRMVTKDGSYRFEVPMGVYVIKAQHRDLQAGEEVTVPDEGVFVLDLILFPSFHEEDELLKDEMSPYLDNAPTNSRLGKILTVVFLVLLLSSIYIFRGRFQKNSIDDNSVQEVVSDEKEDLRGVIDFLKRNGGRATQKDLRKEFGLSEAKISLMVSELESNGIIRKFKKGRGNILILEKRDTSRH